MTIRFYLILFIFGLCGYVQATHNRAGEITYRHLHGNTYEFFVKTCTKLTAEADRPELYIEYGDGTIDTIQRITAIPNAATDTKENTYRGVHTYTGPGTFIIRVEDPNRNIGVINIANSVEKMFCIQTELIISPFIGTPNNSLSFENCPCPEIACLNQPWVYNLSASDIDGDSLSYTLIPCKGENCIDFAMPQVYQYPQQVGGGTLTIHPVTGTILWDSPGIIGEYNMAFLVTEWRNGFKIGSVIMDMQLTVAPCNNQAPSFEAINDVCIEAGQNFQQIIQASDPNIGQTLTITATGSPFLVATNPATFSSTSAPENVTGTFQWTPDCNAIRNSPYATVFEVNDNGNDVPLRDIMVWNITVSGPPVQGLIATPIGSTISLSWDEYFCDNIQGYNVYRSTDSIAISENCCNSINYESLGYELIATTTDESFVDQSELVIGNRYCYIVTAVMNNGTESCPSSVDCAQLEFAVPILTHVTIHETNNISGADTVRWTHPLELNAVLFPGPYQYRLYRASGLNFPNIEIFQSTIEPVLTDCDTLFEDLGLNTVDTDYRYRIELWSDGQVVGSGAPSSSVYLSLIANDNQLELTWTDNSSWFVDSTEIYRESAPGSGIFSAIGWSYSTSYIDSGLINLQEYCYKVKTYGHYSIPEIISPLENWSQEACGIPYDNTPPCAPVLQINSDCDQSTNIMQWTNPNNSCADDVTRYNIYFSPLENEEPVLIETIQVSSDTSFVHFLPLGTAGCYYVTAIDSIPYNNESEPSNTICVQHCPPVYVLPNVITPNGDGVNDVFHPLLPYKFVEKVDFALFNRWGSLLYETKDPMISWTGIDTESGKAVTDGVYFYSCRVYFLTLSGEKTIDLHGFVHVFNGK